MTPAVAIFGASAACLAFLSGHSMWRFALRQQWPSIVNGLMPLLVFFYVGTEFSANAQQFGPTATALVVLIFLVLCSMAVFIYSVRQKEPWH